MSEIDIKKLSAEDAKRALALLQQEKTRKARIASGEIKGHTWADMTDEQKAKALQSSRKREARRNLMIQKAQAKGITVSDAEVAAFLAKKDAAA